MKRLVVISFLVGLSSVIAAEEKPPLPAGPLIKSAPDFAAWQVTFQYPPKSTAHSAKAGEANPSTPKAGRIAQCTVTKTLPNRCEVAVDESGQKTVFWCAGKIQYTYRPGYNPPFMSIPGNPGDDSYRDMAQDFPEFRWISKENFVGVKAMSGRDCLVFQAAISRAALEPEKKVDPEWEQINRVLTGNIADAGGQKSPGKPLDDPQKTSPTAASIAYVDLVTRLPVLLSLPSETRSYKFLPAPTAILPLPGDIAKQVEGFEQYSKKLAQPALRPY